MKMNPLLVLTEIIAFGILIHTIPLWAVIGILLLNLVNKIEMFSNK